MAERDMDKFIEILKTGDFKKLVDFAKKLTNCPNCDYPIEWKDNKIYCDNCKQFGFREPSVIPDDTGVW